MWALGYQQCKWSYYPESNVKEVTNKMRDLQIPCDAIYLDIDYMEGFRCFTWDNQKFPDPKRMVDELKADGFKTMVIIDPGIKKDNDYDVFTEGLEKGYFCKRVDGPYIEGKVWPGECYFPDFTRPEVREWWAGLYKGLIEDVGVAGVWNDMNEPALFEVESKTFPLDVVHDYDGNTTSHRKAHNIYGMQMARATADGVKRFRNGERTLIITRSGYSGLQRFSSVWTGDNIATWEHLWLADVQAQRLAVSGISFCGSDIGGFIDTPSSELMIRWIQLGIFHPFCRVHSSGDHGDQEPWSFGEECTDLFRRFVEIRYQLIGYLYTAFYDYHKTGNPMLKPLVFFNQEDTHTINIDHEFLCGDKLLVCPIVRPGVQEREMYFPKSRWYNYWDDSIVEGNQRCTVSAPLEQIPLFVKEGSVIPMYPIQQYIGEKEINNITLNIYFKEGEEESQFFNDDLNTFDYESGNFRLATFNLNGKTGEIDITQSIEGDFNTEIKTYTLNVIGFDGNNVIVDGNKIEANKNGLFVITSGFKQLQISK
jgi:alpha-glucosidase